MAQLLTELVAAPWTCRSASTALDPQKQRSAVGRVCMSQLDSLVY